MTGGDWDWVGEIEPAACKFRAGLEAEKWALEHDLTLREWKTKRNFDRLRSIINDTHRGSEERWRARNTGKQSFGEALAGRGRHCVPYGIKESTRLKSGGQFNELSRFLKPAFIELSSVVQSGFMTGRSIDIYELYAAQQRVVLAQVVGLPGLYLRWYPDEIENVDIGFSKNIADNNRKEGTRMMFTWRAYPTTTRAAAMALETAAKRSMRATKKVVYESGDFFRFQSGINALELVHDLLYTHHRDRFRASVDFVSAARSLSELRGACADASLFDA